MPGKLDGRCAESACTARPVSSAPRGCCNARQPLHLGQFPNWLGGGLGSILMSDETSGFLIPPNNVAALTEKIISARTHPHLSAIGQAARPKNSGVRAGANGRIPLDLLLRNYAQLKQRVPSPHRHRGIMPRPSVIILTYNRANLLSRAVANVWQAGTALEVIVVDNASTDNTPQVCEAATVSSALRQRSEKHNL